MKTLLWLFGAGLLVLFVHAAGFYALTYCGFTHWHALGAMLLLAIAIGNVMRYERDLDEGPFMVSMTALLFPTLVALLCIPQADTLEDRTDWRAPAELIAPLGAFLAVFYAAAFRIGIVPAFGLGVLALFVQLGVATLLPRAAQTA